MSTVLPAAMPRTRRASQTLPDLAAIRQEQARWAVQPVRNRLRVLRRFRAELAAAPKELAATVPVAQLGATSRSLADTLVAEVLPLAEACRFLEREAEFILRTRRLGGKGRPLWLRTVEAEVERVPLGLVLIIAPANYPLFLPGVQALQALAAGNAVLWKPAPGGAACAHAFRLLQEASALPAGLLTILDSAPEAAQQAIEAGVDKVVLTGSATTGAAVQHALAESATPSIMELSGCDAVFVLEGADLSRVVDALCFGLRLNGSATCMAPRRVFVHHSLAAELAERLSTALRTHPPVPASDKTVRLLRGLVEDAQLHGAQVLLEGTNCAEEGCLSPTLLDFATPTMQITRCDLFAPALSLIHYSTVEEAATLSEQCPYALTVSLFGPEREARRLASTLTAGTVLLNDLILPTADPRVPFGGRRRSGFGVTRGREGLLAMTASRTWLRQRSKSRIAYAPTTDAHTNLFAGYLQAAHGEGWRTRLNGMRLLGRAASALRSTQRKIK